ncbi:protein spaetzle 5 [Nasonia vitripennis]|uniref:Spaetzle domain-containing protein n=1 Tax=Nasonia vitripennis TaxID=7425 RepID=A0A7M7H1P3_NASVI|nr:protein spaetzle 5 [Nasonia vitripennis]
MQHRRLSFENPNFMLRSRGLEGSVYSLFICQYFARLVMWKCLPLLLLSTLISSRVSANGYHHNEPCSKYGCPLAPPIHEPFVPAPPGHTPKCAKPGLTFCESLERYPQQLIKFLIGKRTLDFEKFLRDESPEDFNAYRKRPEYDYGYDYPKPKVPLDLYPQTSLHAHQAAMLHYDVPLNASRNRYLPSQSVNSFVSQSASISAHQSFGYQHGVQPHLIQFPNQGAWPLRNSRGVESGYHQQQQGGRTRFQNPLLEFASRTRNRAKRQSESADVSLCPTRSQFVTPKAALNNQGNWMYVVNLEDQNKHSQLVKSEVCMSQTCDGLCSLPLGYTSKCQQQYVQKRLVALEGSGNRLYTDVFWFPHGCMCQVTLDY